MDPDEDAREAARQRRIADACLLDGAAPEGRLGLYRRLIQGNLAAVARRLLPRTAATLDAMPEASFDAWFARFLADRGARTPYLRDVPAELVAWATPLWTEAPLPGSLADVARYEVDRFAVDAAPSGPASPALTEVAMDRRLVFVTPVKLARYDHAVHEPDAPPRETHLLLHRDQEHAVQATPLDAAVAPWMALALAGVPLGDALTAGGPLRGEPELLEIARVLADLGARGILLGGEAS